MATIYYWKGLISFCNETEFQDLQLKIQAILQAMLQGDTKSADFDTKTINGHKFHTARVNDTHRLLFTNFIDAHGHNYLLLLEFIPKHRYDAARFLQSNDVLKTFIELQRTAIQQQIDTHIQTTLEEKAQDDTLTFVPAFHHNGHFVPLSTEQQQAVNMQLPWILSGDPGTGKTSVAITVALELYRQVDVDKPKTILVTAKSQRLLDTLKTQLAEIELQENGNKIEIKTYNDAILKIEPENILTISDFEKWFNALSKHGSAYKKAAARLKKLADTGITIEKMYEEMRIASPYKTLEAYEALGSQNAVMDIEHRQDVFLVLQAYRLTFEIKVDPNLYQPKWDTINKVATHIIVEEGQDFAPAPIYTLASALTEVDPDTKPAANREELFRQVNLLICIDPNQSLETYKSSRPQIMQLLYDEKRNNHTHLPTSFRCGKNILAVNQVTITMGNQLAGGAKDKFFAAAPVAAPTTQDGHFYWFTDAAAEETKDAIATICSAFKDTQIAVVSETELTEAEKALFDNKQQVFTAAKLKGSEREVIIACQPLQHPDFVKMNHALPNASTKTAMNRPKGTAMIDFERIVNTLYVTTSRPTKVLVFIQNIAQLAHIYDRYKPFIERFEKTNFNEKSVTTAQDYYAEAIKQLVAGNEEHAQYYFYKSETAMSFESFKLVHSSATKAPTTTVMVAPKSVSSSSYTVTETKNTFTRAELYSKVDKLLDAGNRKEAENIFTKQLKKSTGDFKKYCSQHSKSAVNPPVTQTTSEATAQAAPKTDQQKIDDFTFKLIDKPSEASFSKLFASNKSTLMYVLWESSHSTTLQDKIRTDVTFRTQFLTALFKKLDSTPNNYTFITQSKHNSPSLIQFLLLNKLLNEDQYHAAKAAYEAGKESTNVNGKTKPVCRRLFAEKKEPSTTPAATITTTILLTLIEQNHFKEMKRIARAGLAVTQDDLCQPIKKSEPERTILLVLVINPQLHEVLASITARNPNALSLTLLFTYQESLKMSIAAYLSTGKFKAETSIQSAILTNCFRNSANKLTRDMLFNIDTDGCSLLTRLVFYRNFPVLYFLITRNPQLITGKDLFHVMVFTPASAPRRESNLALELIEYWRHMRQHEAYRNHPKIDSIPMLAITKLPQQFNLLNALESIIGHLFHHNIAEIREHGIHHSISSGDNRRSLLISIILLYTFDNRLLRYLIEQEVKIPAASLCEPYPAKFDDGQLINAAALRWWWIQIQVSQNDLLDLLGNMIKDDPTYFCGVNANDLVNCFLPANAKENEKKDFYVIINSPAGSELLLAVLNKSNNAVHIAFRDRLNSLDTLDSPEEHHKNNPTIAAIKKILDEAPSKRISLSAATQALFNQPASSTSAVRANPLLEVEPLAALRITELPSP